VHPRALYALQKPPWRITPGLGFGPLLALGLLQLLPVITSSFGRSSASLQALSPAIPHYLGQAIMSRLKARSRRGRRAQAVLRGINYAAAPSPKLPSQAEPEIVIVA